MGKTIPLKFKYKNWKGEVGVRTVTPKKIYFGHTAWHPSDGWLMEAFDEDKKATRQFAVKDIIQFL